MAIHIVKMLCSRQHKLLIAVRIPPYTAKTRIMQSYERQDTEPHDKVSLEERVLHMEHWGRSGPADAQSLGRSS